MNIRQVSVKSISYMFANYLSNQLGESHAQKYKYYYSLQILLGTFLEMSFILIVALLLNIFFEAVVCIIVFTSIRFFAGGFHQDTYLKCFLTTTILMLGTALISKFTVTSYSNYTNTLIFIVCTILIQLYSPCDTINKPILCSNRRKKYFIISHIINVFWFCISTYLIFTNKYMFIAPAIGLAALAEAITIMPFIAAKAPLRKKIEDQTKRKEV